MLPEIPLAAKAQQLKERILSLPMTEEPTTHDLPPGLTTEDIEYYHALAYDWRSNPVPILRSAVRKYPDFPPLYTYLLEAYRAKELSAKEIELTREMEKRFPDYLFTRLALAKVAMEEDQGADAMQAALGGHLHLDDLYPERKVFHYAEIWQFYLMVGLILCERDQTSEARGVLHALAELGADESILDTLEMVIRSANIRRFHSLQEEEELLVKVTPAPLPTNPAPASPLVLNHEEARIIVEVGFGMPQDALAALLALPRETFTEDLVRILDYCGEEGAYLLDNIVEADVPVIAGFVLFLMAEIKAQGVVGPVLRFFSLHPSVLGFWLDDIVQISVPLATILGEGIKETFAWLRSPGIDAFSKMYITEGLGELGRRDPACRQRIVEGMADLLSFMFEREPSENILDAIVVSDLVGGLSDMRAKEYLPLIELAYERNLIAKGHVGDLDEVTEQLRSSEPPSAARPILPLLEINRGYIADLDGWEVGEAEAEALSAPDLDLDASFPTQEQVDANVGRNDPCPCGGGKKYKKCCMR